ncbi:MAG TPA: Asp-tRNA(Asn)/Glu-tRNA(Gln) amidotransferase subunit GatB, partial [Actinomycetota bacterium]|nr:Asp-tRNA(Asn)/Glu-tRNA(Gln) amidotransferase subunit GatB [Actinomycetota bacterium]
MSDREAVIGLEVHVELSTRSKMFCGCPTAFGAEPNTQTCPICLGEPGSLPVPNEKAIEYLMLIGLALDCTVAPHSLFHRKNYFYPDMPKNYQISQYDLPLCIDGHLDVDVDGARTRVGITRAHMEEDTGKSLHVGTTGRIADAKYSLIDYNRAGIPLVEIVSEPDIRSAAEAQRYLTELRGILQTLGVSDVRMEEGSMRCDANVSLRARGETAFGTKVEIKNLNSIRSVARALTYEIERQEGLLANGERVTQETRHFDENTGKTHSLRSKEEAFDYRYFPEPDLVPIEADDTWIARIREQLPELPRTRRDRIGSEHGLTVEQASFVAATPASVAYFEGLLAADASARDASVWMAGELARALNDSGGSLDDAPRIRPEDLAALIAAVRDGAVSLNSAKKAFQDAYATGKTPMQIVQEKGLTQVSDDSAVAAIVDEVLAANGAEVERFRSGEEKVFKFLVGQVMKASKGQASPQV